MIHYMLFPIKLNQYQQKLHLKEHLDLQYLHNLHK